MIAEALIGASLILGGWEDHKNRTVTDWKWVPAGLGVGFASLMLVLGAGDWTLGWRASGVLIVCLVAHRKKALNSADAIGFVVLAASPTFFEGILAWMFLGIIAVADVLANVLKHGFQAANERGYPFVTYLAAAFAMALVVVAGVSLMPFP